MINYLTLTAEIIRDAALHFAEQGNTSDAWRIERALGTLTDYCYYNNYDGKVSDEDFDKIRNIYLGTADKIEHAWRESEACAELKKWLADPANRDSECYSDIHKDVYGYRPR